MFIVRIGLNIRESVYHCLIQGKNMSLLVQQRCFLGCTSRVRLLAVMRAYDLCR